MTFLWDIMHNVFEGTTVLVHAKPSTNIKTRRYTFFLLKKFLIGL